MEKEEIKGNLETYKLWLMGEDYDPKPKITIELIDSILKLLNTPSTDLIEEARKEAKEEGVRRFKLTKDFPMHPAN
jgi:hypothetical protein